MHDDVESLVPRHVFQAQGEIAAHRIADHHVQLGEIGDHVQRFAYVDLLEIQRQFFARIARLFASDQLVGILDDRFDLDDEFIVGLIGGMFPLPAGFDHHAHIVALCKGVHTHYRRCEIGHVQLALQIFRQVGLAEIDYQASALLPYIDPDIGIGEIHLYAPSAIAATAKIDVAQRMLLRCLFGFGKARCGHSLCTCRLSVQRDQQAAAIDPGVIGQHLVEVDHQPGAGAGLHDIGAAQIALGEILCRLAQCVSRVGKIERDARRCADGETGWRIG